MRAEHRAVRLPGALWRLPVHGSRLAERQRVSLAMQRGELRRIEETIGTHAAERQEIADGIRSAPECSSGIRPFPLLKENDQDEEHTDADVQDGRNSDPKRCNGTNHPVFLSAAIQINECAFLGERGCPVKLSSRGSR